MYRSEKEKCHLGELYGANDAELLAERQKCKDICYTYNQLCPSQTEKRRNLILSLGKHWVLFDIV